MNDESMNEEIKKIIVSSFLVASCIVLSGCQQPSTLGPKVTAQEIAAEKAYEDRLIAETEAQGGIRRPWRDKPEMHKQFERVAEHVEDAGADVCRDMGLPARKRRCYYYFELSRNHDINASSDGDTVFINGGMMRFVANDDELAGVMSHELAHNLMDHKSALATNGYLGQAVGFALDAAAAHEGLNTQGGFADTGQLAGQLGYSPSFEREADYVGLYIAARAGYDISRIANYWRRLSMAEPENASGDFSHPSNPERFVALQKTIEEINFKRAHGLKLVPEVK